MISNNKIKWQTIKYAIIEFYNKNKLLIITLAILFVLALLTGMFTSIKLYNLDNDIDLSDYSMNTFIDGEVYSFKYFLLRLISNIVVICLLYLFSLNNFLCTFGFALLIYRGFLITLNCTFIIIKLGVGGILSSVLIIFPCQLICLLLLGLVFVVLFNMRKIKKECGIIDHQLLNYLVVLLIGILLIDVIEVLLLVIFKPTTILII